MDARRAFATQVLDQVVKALWELSDEDFDRLIKVELEASVSFAWAVTRKPNRRQAVAPATDEAPEPVHVKLTAARSREEGQRIFEGAFADKERLCAFTKYPELPV